MKKQAQLPSPFDIFAVPLEGTTLIEASAGTGKTHAIAGLYLRLLLETGRRVDQILVVTYTKAATAELKTRLRDRMNAVRMAFLTGQHNHDSFIQGVTDRCPSRQAAIGALERALRDFDEAAIFTIHGFCHRVLADSAFESQRPFYTEIVPDEREILAVVVQDFWRREIYGASRAFAAYALDQGYGPAMLLELVKPHVGKSFLSVVGPPVGPDSPAKEVAYEAALTEAWRIWLDSRTEVMDMLTFHPGLNRNLYRLASLPGWFAGMDAFLGAETPGLTAFDKFEKFSQRRLANAARKGHAPPEHPFFQACDTLLDLQRGLREDYENRLRRLVWRLLETVTAELETRKARSRVQSYNDLLVHVERALSGPHGQTLIRNLLERYSAALIDEFQDTDPLQYRIFHLIYGGTSAPLFMVGDPKQAIYSFRGADIFAYLKGRCDAARDYTLHENWRSDPGLVRAVNTLFSRSPRAFGFEEIEFHPAEPVQRDRETLKIADDQRAPFVIWLVDKGEDRGLLSKEVAGQMAARATAAEIAKLLHLASQGEAHIGARALHGGDLAVLVRTHRQGQWVREALRALGIATVEQGVGSVFETREAMELYRVLAAMAEPHRDASIKAALATEMLGMTGEAIYTLGEDESAWTRHQEFFFAGHSLWRVHGFMRMFRQLLEQYGIPERVLGHPDGERRLTNLLHLAELLEAQAARSRRGLEGLLKWFSEQCHLPGVTDEEALLRLESDENLVKIVTVHKSKGLGYPVVFCPFMWDGPMGEKREKPILYHDPRHDYRATLDLGSTRLAEARMLARQEAFSEDLRLLYVALTRAMHRCYLLWGAVREADRSALAWLLHPPEVIGPDPVDTLLKHMHGLSDDARHADIRELVRASGGAIAADGIPHLVANSLRLPQKKPVALSAKRFPGVVPAGWRVTSFSALMADQPAELPDYDGSPYTRQTAGCPEGERSMFSFPRGAGPGRCLHAILESLDFTSNDRRALETLAKEKLLEHAIDPVWTATVADQIKRVLDTPLDEAARIRLNEVANSQRLSELEFYYPLARLDAKGLRELLIEAGGGYPPASRDFTFSPIEGFMKGYIDLVFESSGRFYLVDYKSNWLGMSVEDYHHSRLPAVMAHEGYYLQYLVYTVALHRYLRQRLRGYDYETHFGGVFYLFLRGMNPDLGPAYGVFRDRPDRVLTEGLDAYF